MPEDFDFIAHHGSRAKFAQFDEDFICHFGFHLGSIEQAKHFGRRVLRVGVRMKNPLRLADLGTWNYQSVIRAARQAGVAISEQDYDEVFNQFDNDKATRRLLERFGFDGIIYANEVEGEGDSIIAFRGGQLAFLGVV